MANQPLFYMLGQDPALKGAVQTAFLTQNLQAALQSTTSLIRTYNIDGAAMEDHDSEAASENMCTVDGADTPFIPYDVTLFRDMLANLFPAGFHVAKSYFMGAVGGSAVGDRWGKTYAEHWADIAAVDTPVRNDITGGGDTPDPKGAFLCFGYQEAILGDPTTDAAFKADLQQFIFDLRADYLGANSPIILDLPPKTVAGYTAAQLTSLASARKVIQEAASADEFVSFIQTDDLSRATDGVSYTGESVLTLGRRMAKEMRLLQLGKKSVDGGGVPVVIVLGEADTVGIVEDSVLNDFGDYNSPQALSKVWNWGSSTWDAYDPTSNSNTEADGLTRFGFDVTLVSLLEQNVFLGTGAYLFKLGRYSSSLVNPLAIGGGWAKSDADIYTTLKTEWAAAKAALIDVEGVVPDVVAIVVCQGEQEVQSDAFAAAYAEALGTFLEDLRADFGTRAEGQTPVLLLQMKDTGSFDPDRVALVREAQANWVEQDPRSDLVDANQLAFHSDLVHLSAEGLLDAGSQLATKLSALVEAQG